MKFSLMVLLFLVSCSSVSHEQFTYSYPTTEFVKGDLKESTVEVSFDGEEKDGLTFYRFFYVKYKKEEDISGTSSNTIKTIKVTNPDNLVEQMFNIDGAFQGSLRDAFEECLFKLRKLGINIEGNKQVNLNSSALFHDLGSTAEISGLTSTPTLEEAENEEKLSNLLDSFRRSYTSRKPITHFQNKDLKLIVTFSVPNPVGSSLSLEIFQLGKVKGIIISEINKESKYFSITEEEWELFLKLYNEKD